MGCGIAIIKYLVFIFNLVFAIIGLALLVIGVIFQLDIKTLSKSYGETLVLAPTFLIIVGSLIFIISFFGCCGAIKESNCMLITYAVLLVLILIIQISIGIFAFMAIRNSVDIKEDVKEEMQDMFNKYNSTVEDKTELDDLQQLLKCCGVEGPADWKNQLPQSCCLQSAQSCEVGSSSVFDTGCTEKGYLKIMMVVRSVGYVVFAICAIELIGIMFAFCLNNSMKNQYRRGAYA